MKPELYVAMMHNSLYEMLCVSFLGDNLTDAEDKAKRYAEQLKAIIVKFDRVPDNGGMTITMAIRRPDKQNKP